MASRVDNADGHSKRGESSLSDFAEYVQQQQQERYKQSKVAPPADQPHDEFELDSILDGLNLTDDIKTIRLRCLLSAPAEQSAGGSSALELENELAEYIRQRIEPTGETIMDVGVEDVGDSMKFSLDEWNTALSRIKKAASVASADVKLLLTRNVGGDLDVDPVTPKDSFCSGTVIIRKRPASQDDFIEIRLSVVGNVDAGKSTLLGVLTKGALDDGRGKARVHLFRHKHEIESGRTSSVGHEIMGFDSTGEIVLGSGHGKKFSQQEVIHRAAKVIAFTDLAGHERYLKTTIFGIHSSEPHYCLLMIAANNGLIGMSKEHLGIALAMHLPIMVVITKIDICPPQILEQTISQLTKILKSPGSKKLPFFIKTRAECINTATNFVSSRICPIFQVSNVTGENLDLLRSFLNLLPQHGDYNADAPLDFRVNDTFSVPFVGTVVSGIVKSGVAHTGDHVLIGPNSNGVFVPTKIRSIERSRINIPACTAGQSVAFALRHLKRKDVRKGMVVLHKPDANPSAVSNALSPGLLYPGPISHGVASNAGSISSAFEPPKAISKFVAEILMLSHPTTVRVKYQAMVHIGPIMQTCAIIGIDREYIRTGDRSWVAFKFVQRPEYISVGDRILLREGRTKGLGVVKRLGYDPNEPPFLKE